MSVGEKVNPMFKELPHQSSCTTSHITRRVICAAPVCAAAWTGAARAQGAAPSLSDDVDTYLGFGEHRVGMPSEERTARWIRERLNRLGYRTDFQFFPIRTILQPGGQIVVGGVRADVFAQWLPPASALGRTIEAPLLAIEAEKGPPSVRIITQPIPAAGDWGAAQDALVNEAVAKGALALVMAAQDLSRAGGCLQPAPSASAADSGGPAGEPRSACAGRDRAGQ